MVRAGMTRQDQAGAYWQPLWRQRTLFLGVFAAVMGLVVAALIVLPVRYLATAYIAIAEQEPNAGNSPPDEKIGDPADVESQLLMIRSSRMLRLAMEDPNAKAAVAREYKGGEIPSGTDSGALLDHIETRYSVSSVGRSRVIGISYQSPFPETAQTMANTLTNAFLTDRRKGASESRKDASTWLRAQAAALDAGLRADEANIESFRLAKGLMRGTLAPITAEQLTNISQRLSAAEAARAEAAAQLQEINAGRGKGAGDAPAVLASRAVADVKQQLNVVTSQIANSASSLGPDHPSLRALVRERDNLQRRLAIEIATVAASTKKSYLAANALCASLKKQRDAAKADAGTAMDDEATLARMTRDADIKRGQHDALIKHADDLEVERRVLLGGARLVSLAELPILPFFPKRIPFLAAGLVLGLIAAAAAAVMRDRADGGGDGAAPRRPRDDAPAGPTASAASIAAAPVFARLPRLAAVPSTSGEGWLGRRSAPLPLDVALRNAQTDPALQEALRGFYARISRAGGDRPLKTILVTSAVPHHGKTFTTLALAQYAAARGRKVLVIEGDMRNPAFEAVLQTDAAPGLDAVLRGETTAADSVVATSVRNLFAVPAGAPLLQSTELLMGKPLQDLLRYAQSYDLVLIDSPPSNASMDACVLAKFVDGVICCARAGRSKSAETAATISDIRAAGGDVLGMAITMDEPSPHPRHRGPVPVNTPLQAN